MVGRTHSYRFKKEFESYSKKIRKKYPLNTIVIKKIFFVACPQPQEQHEPRTDNNNNHKNSYKYKSGPFRSNNYNYNARANNPNSRNNQNELHVQTYNNYQRHIPSEFGLPVAIQAQTFELHKQTQL